MLSRAGDVTSMPTFNNTQVNSIVTRGAGAQVNSIVTLISKFL